MEIRVRFRDYPVREQASSEVETVPTRKGNDIVRHPQKWGSDLANHITVALEDRISALTTKDPNKLKVYTDLFDGHCLRAYSYFGEDMPDIEMAPEGAECYTANVGGTDIFFHSEEDVEYLGKQMKGKELYELLTSQGL